MDLALIKQRLNGELDSFLRGLFPEGKKHGTEFVVGSISGEPGESLKIKLSGSKAGIWSDFATGDGGDILDLVTAKRGGTFADNLRYLTGYLGIKEPKAYKKIYAACKKPPNLVKPKETVLTYLSERGLSLFTLDAYKIGQLTKHQIKVNGSNTESDCVAFPFFDCGGELRMIKYLALVRDNGKKVIWTGADARPTLYGWHAIDPKARSVIICEGEINAMSWHEYGFNALATPRGAGKGAKHEWIAEEWDELGRFEDIILDFDNDEAGREAINDLIERLGRHRVRVIQKEDLAPDINDRLRAKAPKDEIQALLDCARSIEPDNLKPAVHFMPAVMNLFYPGDDPIGWQLPFTGFDNFRLRLSELSIWTGFNFHGKTSLLSQVTLHLLSQEMEKVMVVSPELRPERQLERLIRQLTGAKLPEREYIERSLNWLTGRYWLYNQTGPLKVDEIFETAEYAIKRYGVRFLIVDSLMKLGLGVEDWSGQKLLTERFHTFALQQNIHIALVAHPRKEANEAVPPTRHSVAGVGHITDLADTVMVVWRNIAKHRKLSEHYNLLKNGLESPLNVETFKALPDAKLLVEKERNGDGDLHTVALWYDWQSMQYRTEPHGAVSRPIVILPPVPTGEPTDDEEIIF